MVHTDDGELVRFISAREATHGERKSYEGGDVKAVARTEFILFSEDIKPTLASVNDRK